MQGSTGSSLRRNTLNLIESPRAHTRHRSCLGGPMSHGVFLPPAALQLHLLESPTALEEPPSHTMYCPYSRNRSAQSLINKCPLRGKRTCAGNKISILEISVQGSIFECLQQKCLCWNDFYLFILFVCYRNLCD